MTLHTLACRIAAATTALFGHPLTVGALTLASVSCGIWWAIHPAQMSGNLLLSILALQIAAGIQWSGANDTIEIKRALAELVVATDGAADEAAPLTETNP